MCTGQQMSSLPDRLKRVIKFDKEIYAPSSRYAAHSEHARLKPVLDALVECVISLRMYSNDNMRSGSTVTPYWADEALAKLEAALKEIK